ncbi:MAG: acyl-CoA reductase [Myxococcota bacterium]|nr:acyl-CoA reductase [Myxococcota bacterium]
MKSGTKAPEMEAALRRLEDAATVLRDCSLQERLDGIGELLNRFGNPKTDWHRRLVDQTVQTSGFSEEGIKTGLRMALADWNHSTLQALVGEELGSPDSLHYPTPMGHPRTSVILAGVIPMPNLLNTILPLVVGSPVIVKPSRGDPHTPNLIVECLSEIDPELGRCIEVISLKSADQEAMQLLLRSPCVMASGSDETMDQIRRQLSPDQTFIAYGHKFSIAIVDSSSLVEAERREEIADALSMDIALWDQLGCLSPAAIYVVGEQAHRTRLDLLDALAEKMAFRERAWPRGTTSNQTRADIRRERDEAEMRATLPGGPELRGSPSSDWTVIAESGPDWRPTPLHRFVRLYPVTDLAELRATLHPMRRHLSSVAVDGFPEGSVALEELIPTLQDLGFSRICRAGQLQTPPLSWPHDGQPVLLPLVRNHPS